MKGIAFYENSFFTIKEDVDLYAEELKRLIMTNPGERLGQPYFGVGLKHRLFELGDNETAEQVKQSIIEQVETYLPTVELIEIQSKLEENSFFIDIKFIEKGELAEDARLLSFEFEGEEE
jgi:phage baseplate assembly protein W